MNIELSDIEVNFLGNLLTTISIKPAQSDAMVITQTVQGLLAKLSPKQEESNGTEDK